MFTRQNDIKGRHCIDKAYGEEDLSFTALGHVVPSFSAVLGHTGLCYRFRNPKNIPTAPAPVEGR
jgi:hypothetical protein